MSKSTIRDHLKGISKEFSKSTYKKILDITNQILDKRFIEELRNEYEQNTEFVFNKLLFIKVEEFLDSLFGDNPLNVSPSIIPSQQELADMISVSRGSIRKFLEEKYLSKYNNSDQIYKKFWPSPSSPEYTEPKKILLFKILDEQLEKYPEQEVMSITDLTKLIGKTIKGTTLISLSGWIKMYLIKRIIEDNPNFNINLVESLADKMYSEIWYSPQKNPISYKDIRLFIETRGGKLITGRISFDKMSELPTQRYVEIRCEKKHIFEMRVSKFLYGHQWCPNCKIRFCQKITNLFVQKILNYLSSKEVKLRQQQSLKKVFGIASDKGGRYILDNYAENIKIIGKNKEGVIIELILKIAAEYDGIQHDKYPNPFHKTQIDLTNFK